MQAEVTVDRVQSTETRNGNRRFEKVADDIREGDD
jgi:hypothetical protein